MTLANLTLLAAVCSSSARLVPLALLLLADRCEAYGTICDNSVSCSSGCPTGVYGTSLCDGTYTGTEVDLNSQGLSGTIPPQLGDISLLKHLSLEGNSISGTIPAEMSKLSQLKYVRLYNNIISGTIPSDMGKLSQLYNLWLNNNAISGTIPPETGKLSQLNILSLNTNSISGTIPSETGKLSQLTCLQLYNNNISGTVPPELSDLPLERCSLGGVNNFACPLPTLPDVCTLNSIYPPECNRDPAETPLPAVSSLVGPAHFTRLKTGACRTDNEGNFVDLWGKSYPECHDLCLYDIACAGFEHTAAGFLFDKASRCKLHRGTILSTLPVAGAVCFRKSLRVHVH